MNDYPLGWSYEDDLAEAALRADLDQLVAAQQLTEAEAQRILPGYEYPELLLWIRPPADQLNPLPIGQVRARGAHLLQHQNLSAAAARQQDWHDQHEHLAYDEGVPLRHLGADPADGSSEGAGA